MRIDVDGITRVVRDTDPSECKGLVFRARIRSYVQRNKEIVYKEELRFLKRKSCTGCAACDCFWDDLDDWISTYDFPNCVNGFIDGELYKLVYGKEQRDWETGVGEGCDIDLVKFNE